MKAVIGALLNLFPAPEHPSLRGPGTHVRWRRGWVKGWLVRPIWKVRGLLGGPSVQVGRRFSLQGQLLLSGPGRLILGDDVIVDAVCTPFTHGRDAVIRVGSRVFLNGTRMGCSREITVGDDCILADARIMDTDFHAVHRRRQESGMVPEVAPVRIGRNVWIAAASAVLKGVEIGDDCVVAYGSVVNKSVAAGKIVGGNPAREIGDVAPGPSKVASS